MTDSRPVSIPSAAIQRGLNQRRVELDRIDAQSVKLFKVSGRVQVIGDGECSFDVTFPVTFCQLPRFSFGWELGMQTSALVGGSLPGASAGVARWAKNERVTGVFNYTGATLVAVTSNNPRYLFIHWHVEGRAFHNPISNLGAGDPLSQ